MQQRIRYITEKCYSNDPILRICHFKKKHSKKGGIETNFKQKMGNIVTIIHPFNP